MFIVFENICSTRTSSRSSHRSTFSTISISVRSFPFVSSHHNVSLLVLFSLDANIVEKVFYIKINFINIINNVMRTRINKRKKNKNKNNNINKTISISMKILRISFSKFFRLNRKVFLVRFNCFFFSFH